MLAEAEAFVAQAEAVWRGLPVPAVDVLVLDWAGIGDAAHARLIAQHLAKDASVAWVTHPLVAGLYRDDPMPVLPGVTSPWRNAAEHWQVAEFAPAMHRAAQRVFDGRLVDVSAGVVAHYGTWHAHQTNYADLFFGGAGVTRDPRIRHRLQHRGCVKDGAYVCIETTSLTHGALPGSAYLDFVTRLAKREIRCYTVGGKDDELAAGSLDFRGRDLYDTYTLIKGARAFVGRASGCQSLTYPASWVKLVEVDVPAWSSAEVCGYHKPLRVALRELADLAVTL